MNMSDIQKAAIEALKLCEHGNYHCMICEVRLLKLVIAEKDAEIAELNKSLNRIIFQEDEKGANTCAPLSI